MGRCDCNTLVGAVTVIMADNTDNENKLLAYQMKITMIAQPAQKQVNTLS